MLAFALFKEHLPTGQLLQASEYRQLLEGYIAQLLFTNTSNIYSRLRKAELGNAAACKVHGAQHVSIEGRRQREASSDWLHVSVCNHVTAFGIVFRCAVAAIVPLHQALLVHLELKGSVLIIELV